jgi:hypothetical protein
LMQRQSAHTCGLQAADSKAQEQVRHIASTRLEGWLLTPTIGGAVTTWGTVLQGLAGPVPKCSRINANKRKCGQGVPPYQAALRNSIVCSPVCADTCYASSAVTFAVQHACRCARA